MDLYSRRDAAGPGMGHDHGSRTRVQRQLEDRRASRWRLPGVKAQARVALLEDAIAFQRAVVFGQRLEHLATVFSDHDAFRSEQRICTIADPAESAGIVIVGRV